jgi:GNAT superfamily N-acetyltransferase
MGADRHCLWSGSLAVVLEHQLFYSVAYNNVIVFFRIVPIPHNDDILREVATWSMEQWGADFPNDTIDTYVSLYKDSIASTSGLPRVFVALDDNDTPIGTITCIDDDELPDAIEEGPWLAALFVLPECRQSGIGQALVDAVVQHARSCGFNKLYLYTERHVAWYEKMGWAVVREATLSDHVVTVMTRSL